MPEQDNPEALSQEVIRLLQEERERRGLSKYQVAANSGLSQQSVYYAEHGLRHPSFETVLKLSAGIGVRLESVIEKARKNLKGR